jgi:hypothetical protein
MHSTNSPPYSSPYSQESGIKLILSHKNTVHILDPIPLRLFINYPYLYPWLSKVAPWLMFFGIKCSLDISNHACYMPRRSYMRIEFIALLCRQNVMMLFITQFSAVFCSSHFFWVYPVSLAPWLKLTQGKGPSFAPIQNKT